MNRRFYQFVLAVLLPSCLEAATFTWDGSSDQLVSNKANWAGNKSPGGNPDLVFGNSSQLTVEFDFGNGATTVADDVTFVSSAGSYTIESDGTGTLKVGNIDNQSSSLQTFDIPLEFQNKETVLAGGPVQFNQAVTTKTGNNELTFTGSAEIIAGADDVFSGNIDLFLSGTTLNLSNTNQSFTSISISGDSIIDFGGSSAAINLDFLDVSSGTLTVRNWTGDPGDFQVSNTVDAGSLANITFEGWDGATWDPFDGVTPTIIPEPGAYGAIFMGLSSAIWWCQRRRRPTRDHIAMA